MSPERSMPKLDWEISRYQGTAECPIGQIQELRRLCWPSISAAGESLEDGFDEGAWHWTVRSEHRLIAAARLTIHNDLIHIPEAHLFRHIVSHPLPRPIGYISRLIIHPEARRNGLSRTLDHCRLEACRELGVKSLIANWTPQSGVHRKRQLMELGFQSPDGDAPHPDGAFGVSYIYWMPLSAIAI